MHGFCTNCRPMQAKKIYFFNLNLTINNILLILSLYKSVDGYEAKKQAARFIFSSPSQCSNLILFDIYYFVLPRLPLSNRGFLQPTLHKIVSFPPMTEQQGLRAEVWLFLTATFDVRFLKTPVLVNINFSKAMYKKTLTTWRFCGIGYIQSVYIYI